MKRCGWFIVGILFVFIATDIFAQPVHRKPKVKPKKSIEIVTYSYLDNFKAKLLLPDSLPPHPVIIYSYDEFYEQAGVDGAMQQGYDLETVMRTFQGMGYAVLVPERRHHNPKSIKGAIRYLKNRKDMTGNKISLVGVSQGAFLSLFASVDESDLAALILLAPKAIHDTGMFSLSSVHRHMRQFRTPTLMLVGNEAPNSDVMSGRKLRKLLVLGGKELQYKEYYVNKRWFWNPAKQYMQELNTFIQTRISPPIPVNPLLDSRG